MINSSRIREPIAQWFFMKRALPNKTARALALFVALTIAPYVVPALARYRVPIPEVLTRALRLRTSVAAAPTDIQPAKADDSTPVAVAIKPAPGEIEDPSGRALDGLFASLLKTEIEGSQTRICHYGDSPITNDGITSTVRHKLQLRFGDAGHGFHSHRQAVGLV